MLRVIGRLPQRHITSCSTSFLYLKTLAVMRGLSFVFDVYPCSFTAPFSAILFTVRQFYTPYIFFKEHVYVKMYYFTNYYNWLAYENKLQIPSHFTTKTCKSQVFLYIIFISYFINTYVVFQMQKYSFNIIYIIKIICVKIAKISAIVFIHNVIYCLYVIDAEMKQKSFSAFKLALSKYIHCLCYAKLCWLL